MRRAFRLLATAATVVLVVCIVTGCATTAVTVAAFVALVPWVIVEITECSARAGAPIDPRDVYDRPRDWLNGRD